MDFFNPREGWEPSRRWDGLPETEADTKFVNLREAGFTGWIDQNGDPASCPRCGSFLCTASFTEPCNG